MIGRFEYIVNHIDFFIVSKKQTGSKYRLANNKKIDIKKLFLQIKNEFDEIDFYSSSLDLNIITNLGIYNKGYKGKELEKIFKRIIEK